MTTYKPTEEELKEMGFTEEPRNILSFSLPFKSHPEEAVIKHSRGVFWIADKYVD